MKGDPQIVPKKAGSHMNQKLRQDLIRFFAVYQDRTASLLTALPAGAREELDEELGLLKRSVLNRLAEEFGR